MNPDKAPTGESGGPVCSTLFLLWDAPAAGPGETRETEHFRESFSRLLPHLNLSSTCTFISRERPEESTCFDGILSEISSFLERNRFVQVSLRPVHAFSGKDAEAWVGAYLRTLRTCRPFQEEGYRQQIISRLRVFPVICLEDAAALFEARPFLTFLQESFFLPSILLPTREIEEIAACYHGQEEPPWVRTYLTDASPFDCRRTLEILCAHETFDKMLEDPSSPLPERNDLLCKEMFILESGNAVRSCLQAGRTDGNVLERTDGFLDPSFTALPEGAGLSGSLCMDCLLPYMLTVGLSYRVNPQGAAAWNQLCDRMATRWVRRGRHDVALTIWRASALAYPHDARPASLLTHMALCAYETGDLEKAMGGLQEARKATPLSPDIRYYMGKCEFGWKDYIEAADRFREAIELGLPPPLLWEAQYYRGLSHYHLEEYDEALEALEEAERAGMAGSPLPFYQGLCLLGKGEPGRALPRFQEALSRGPSPEDLFSVLFYVAHTYKEMADFSTALEYCERAERIEPGRYEVWNLKGFCHFKQRRHDEAIACFRKAIEIDPTSGIDYANIGSNLRDKGDRQGAIAMYRKALSMDPTIEFARDSLRRLLEAEKAGS